MADQISAALPRLADALLEVGTRLGELGAELHSLVPAADQPAGPPATPASGLPTSRFGGRTALPAGPATEAPHPTEETAQQPPSAVPYAGTQQAATSTGQQPSWAPQQAAFTTGQQPPYPAPAPPPGGQRPFWSTTPLPPPEPTPSLWERLSRDGAGSRILAWAGGVVTLAGVVLLLILAIQRGYLGPLPRVLLGAGLGLVLTGIGTWLHRSPTARTGAYALAATGIAMLYLAVVAATALYHFLPPWGGLLTGLAVTAGGIALAGVWDAELLAIFVVVCCAVSSPIITKGFDGLLLSFLLVLLLGTTPVQL